MKTWTTFPARRPTFLLLFTALVGGAFGLNRGVKTASIVGFLLDLRPGTFLARSPGSAPDQATAGSPVLVLEQSEKGWVRVLAADGSAGWAHITSRHPVAVRVGANGSVSDRSPDDPSPAEAKDLKGNLRVLGASKKNATPSLKEMMLPPDRNWYLTPWLKLSGASGAGWIAPSEAGFEWPKTLQARGMVRPPFTTQYQGLGGLQPHEGDSVLRVEESGESASPGKVSVAEHWPRVHAIWFSEKGPQAILFANDSERVLRLAVNERGGFLVFRKYLPELDRVECAAAAEGSSVCLAQVTAPNGDGYVSSVWIMYVSGDGVIGAKNVELEAGSGEASEQTMANWWWNGDTQTLGVVSATQRDTGVVIYHYARSAGLTEERRMAVGVFLPLRASYTEARAESIAVTKNELDVFPIEQDQRIQWAPGRVFASRVEAEFWKKEQKFETEIRTLGSASREEAKP